MATKENMAEVVKVLKDLLEKGDDWATLTINGLTIQKLPANKSKASSLALIFNPIIGGLQSRKGKYFHDKDGFIGYLGAINEVSDLATRLLMLISKVNPKTSTISKSVKSDYTFAL